MCVDDVAGNVYQLDPTTTPASPAPPAAPPPTPPAPSAAAASVGCAAAPPPQLEDPSSRLVPPPFRLCNKATSVRFSIDALGYMRKVTISATTATMVRARRAVYSVSSSGHTSLAIFRQGLRPDSV